MLDSLFIHSKVQNFYPCYSFMMNAPKAVLFDLDDTLADSFHPPSPDMLVRLEALLEVMPVAIVSGASYERIQKDVLSRFARKDVFASFYIICDSAAQCYAWSDDKWKRMYDFEFTAAERAEIVTAIWQSVAETGVLEENSAFSPIIEDNGVQIAFVALGTQAPQDLRKAWDPDQAKRKALQAAIQRRLPSLNVLIGGKTSIDITHEGIDKAYGVKWLSKELGMPAGKMLFVGDALYPGGNDYVVIDTGIQTRKVSGPAETLAIIDEILASA